MWSITITMSADGHVTVTGTDRAGGCPYQIASRPPGGMTSTNEEEVRAAIWEQFHTDRNYRHPWIAHELRPALEAMAMCLPPADVFDDII